MPESSKYVPGPGKWELQGPKSGKCLLEKLAWDPLISIVFYSLLSFKVTSVKIHMALPYSSPKNWIPILK